MNTKVREYIQEKLQTWRSPAGVAQRHSNSQLDDLLRDVPEGYDFTPPYWAEVLAYEQENVLEDGLLMIWRMLEERLRDNRGGGQIRDSIGFGASLCGDVNAFAFPCGHGTHGVCVDLQLPAYLLFASVAIAAHYEIGGPYKGAIINAEQFAYEIGSRTLWFVGEHRAADQIPSSIHDLRRLTPTKLHSEFCMQLMRGQVTFVLCHEIAHILAGHTEGTQPLSRYVRNARGKAMAGISEQTIYSRSQLQEFEADRVAIHLMLHIARADRTLQMAAYDATNMLFSIFHYFESLLNALYGSDSSTHPPAADRRRAINSEFRKQVTIDPDQIRLMDFIFDYTDVFAKGVKRM